MIEITGLWENKDKDGNTYLSGNLGRNKIFIFKNNKKTEEKQPDWRLLIAESKKQQQPKENQEKTEMAWED